jgi:uncharacterized membrane protein
MQVHYIPVPIGLYAIFFVIALALVLMLEIGALSRAYEALGLGRGMVTLVLLGSLVGAYVNIPIWRLPGHRIVAQGLVEIFGIPLIAPVETNYPGTILAVNVGGAVIPVALSVYLLFRNAMWASGALATAIVAAIVHQLATPVPGMGISVPLIAPPLIAAAAALALSWRNAAPLAYISGSLGVLIGADLLNLGKIWRLGASVASIGGAGTFDGVFLTGVVAVLIASFGRRRRA